MTDTEATTTGRSGSADAIPAAWYPDPQNPSALRWWNGTGWTEHTSHPTVSAPRRVGAPAASAVTQESPRPTAPTPAPLTRRELRAREAAATGAGTGTPATAEPLGEARTPATGARTGTPAPAPLAAALTPASPTAATPTAVPSTPAAPSAATTPASALPPVDEEHHATTEPHVDDAPMLDLPHPADRAAMSVIAVAPREFVSTSRMSDPADVGRVPASVFTPLAPTRVFTPAVWIIAVTPLIAAGIQWVSATPTPVGGIPLMRLGLGLALLVLTVLLAVLDRRMLRDAGHTDTATPVWMLLSPLAYLIARGIRVRQETQARSAAPLAVWVVLALIAAVLSTGLLVPMPG